MDQRKDGSQKKRKPLRSITNVLGILIFTFKNLSVEPIIFLVFLAWIFGSTLQSPGIYRRVCELHYGEVNECDLKFINEPDHEDMVQERNAEWSLFTALAYFIPAIFADTILGAYGDRNGRKLNILLGLIGITISEFGYLLVLSERVKAPFWIMLIFNFVSGITGFITMIPVSCNAYLSDITPDSDMLTIRSGIFTIFQSLASIIGAVVAGFAYNFDVTYAIDIELGLYFCTFLYVLWKIPHTPGIEEIARRYSSGEQDAPFLSQLKQLLKEGFAAYLKPRLGYRRAFVFISVAVLMISYTISAETRISMVINSYVFRRADKGSLAWNQKDLGFWNGSGFAITMVGTLIGLYLFKQVLRFRETTLIIIGLLSSIARTLFIGFATKSWYMYVGNACGLFVGLIQPAVVSFIVQLVSAEEIGRVFALFGIGNDLAFVFTYLIYSNIYRATQAWYSGFLFMFIAGVQVMALLIMFWVHFQSVYDGVGKKYEVKQTDIATAIAVIGNPPLTPSLPTHPEKKFKKQVSIYEHALARNAKKKAASGEDWWESSPSDIRKTTGSFY